MLYQTTDELLQVISEKNDFKEVLDTAKSNINNPTFSYYLYTLLETYHLSPSALMTQAAISRAFAYQILNGTRLPSRNTLLRIVLALKFTLEETALLLTLAQKGSLYPRCKRDAALIFCIQHHKDLIDTETLLTQLGEDSLYKLE